MRPQISVCRNHAFKRKNGTSVVFVCNSKPDSVIFRFALFKNTVTKLRVVCTTDFLNIKEDYTASKSVIIHIEYISNYNIITCYKIAYSWTTNTAFKMKVVIWKSNVSEFSKNYKARKEGKVNQIRVKTVFFIRNIEIIPGFIFVMIQIFFKNKNLIFCQMSFSNKKLFWNCYCFFACSRGLYFYHNTLFYNRAGFFTRKLAMGIFKVVL